MSSSHNKDRSGKGRGKGYGGRRGGRQNDPGVELSKTLSYILRHGAQREGLIIRSDGYVKLDDLFCRPKLRGVDLNAVKHVVETSDKQRFTLLFVPEEEDGVQGLPVQIPAQLETEQIPGPMDLGVAEGSASGDKGKGKVSADDITSGPGTWWIRANQGHTIKVDDLELTLINDHAEVPVAIHGTYIAAWNKIAKKGLSIMGRNHIHIAVGRPGASGVLSGMRVKSEILIHIDMAKAMGAGIKFYRSSNNVILTSGNEEGFLLKEYFSLVEQRDGEPVDTSWRTN